MIPAQLLNHLWQSTVFAVAAGLLTLALRKNRAPVRYWLWFAASYKFLIPFSLLVTIGSQVEWRKAQVVQRSAIPFVMEQISQPFASSAPPPAQAKKPPVSGATVLLCVWLGGLSVVVFFWFRQWRRIRAAMRVASPLRLNLPIQVMSSPARLEPGVFGIFRPVLLVPEGITDCLTPAQWEAIFAHELCHVRRRDNLTAAIHMAVEAVFWFHPLMWWIGKRLVDERERACDEEVLSLGSEPLVYAEGILNVCKLYVGLPLACVSGVTGSTLRRRLRAIMTHRGAKRMSMGKRVLLATVGASAVAAPILVGILNAPPSRAQSQTARSTFAVASIKASKSTDRDISMLPSPGGRFVATNVPLKLLIRLAYGVLIDDGIQGGPNWIASDRYDIVAKAEGNDTPSTEQLKQMIQALLEDRCALKIHHETKQGPVYALVVTGKGPKFQESKPGTGDGRVKSRGNQLTGEGITMAQLAMNLPMFAPREIDRPVLDRTGLSGVYDIKLARDESGPTPESSASILTSIKEQLGLALESTKGAVDVLVIDHLERPSEN